MTDGDRYIATVDELFGTFRGALLAILPMADRAKMNFRDEETHRDWERLAECSFDSPFDNVQVVDVAPVSLKAGTRTTLTVSTISLAYYRRTECGEAAVISQVEARSSGSRVEDRGTQLMCGVMQKMSSTPS